MKTQNTEHKVNKKENARKWTLRIFALFLALLLIISTFYYLIASITELL